MEQLDEKIKNYLQKIINLLRKNDEPDWARVFEKFLHDFDKEQNKKVIAKMIMDIYRGGMGSFNDLVLQKNMKMLREENDSLAILKHDLFNACVDYLAING